MTVHPDIRAVLDREFGRYDVVADHSWSHGGAAVVEVREASGASWIAKRHSVAARHHQEVAAYRHWMPALDGSAPRLRAADADRQVLVLSKIAGEPAGTTALQPETQRLAGVVLRRLHEAEPAVGWPDFATIKLDEYDQSARAAEGLIDTGQLDTLRCLIRDLAQLPAPDRVPCHLDYSPRNWLVSDGQFGVIDFEWAAREVWCNDLIRLHFGVWQERPDLRDAFLDGYGRSLGADDLAILRGCGLARQVWLLPWARSHGEADLERSARHHLGQLTAG